MSESTRGEVVRVGVDLAKRVIQVHAVDGAGRVVAAKPLSREKFMPWCAQLPRGCIVAMETGGGAHHWARRLRALGLDARLVAAHFVSPYRMQGARGKNDANDAAAICEAASRPQSSAGRPEKDPPVPQTNSVGPHCLAINAHSAAGGLRPALTARQCGQSD